MQHEQVFIKMAVDAWQTQNTRLDKLLAGLTDEQLSAETAPGRNTGRYLFGHLVAVSDGMLPLLGFGDKLHPELENIYLTNPDKSGLEEPSIAELKTYWKEINARLSEKITATGVDEWFTRHNAVSAEDFAKEPHRNKLNILLNRTNHQSYHIGQMIYLKGK